MCLLTKYLNIYVVMKFCGDTIAGLCLVSSAVMRLTHEARPHLALDALLQRRCLYIMRLVYIFLASRNPAYCLIGRDNITSC